MGWRARQGTRARASGTSNAYADALRARALTAVQLGNGAVAPCVGGEHPSIARR